MKVDGTTGLTLDDGQDLNTGDIEIVNLNREGATLVLGRHRHRGDLGCAVVVDLLEDVSTTVAVSPDEGWNAMLNDAIDNRDFAPIVLEVGR